MNPTAAVPMPHHPARQGVPLPRRPLDPKLWKAAKEFQEIFLGQFVKMMRSSPVKTELLEEYAGREIFNQIFSEAIAKEMADSGSLGLDHVIYRELGGAYRTTKADAQLPLATDPLDDSVQIEKAEEHDAL